MTKVRVILLIGLIAVVALTGCRSAHTTSAILYIDQQQYQKAVDVLHEGLTYNPDEPDAYFWLGEAHTKLAEAAVLDNQYEKAKQNYQLAYQYYVKARQLDPEHFTDQVEQALQHSYLRRSREARTDFDGKYYEQAEGQYRLAYAALPDSIAPIKNIARMKMQMAAEKGRDDQGREDPELLGEALDLLNKVLDVRPDAYELLWDKANVLTALGRKDESQAIYDELMKEHGDDPGLLIDIANLAVDQKDYERAADLSVKIAEIYQKDNETDNDNEIAGLLARAATWYAFPDIGRYEESLRLFDQALQREPSRDTQREYLSTYYNYGEFLKGEADKETDPQRKADLTAKANEQYSHGVDVGNALVAQYPDFAIGYYFLALCQFALGETQTAESNIKKYDELQPQAQPQAGTGG